MKIRAKLYCTEKKVNPGGSGEVKFETAYDESVPEDRRFCEATPWGEARFGIDNRAALDRFEPGNYYYADFFPVPEE